MSFDTFNIRVMTEEQGEMLLECTPDNTTAYLHHPLTHYMYDHIFWRMPEEMKPEEARGRNLGSFVWREILGADEFNALIDNMRKSYNWNMVYRPVPTDSDRVQYHDFAQGILHRELDDIEPEDFA